MLVIGSSRLSGSTDYSAAVHAIPVPFKNGDAWKELTPFPEKLINYCFVEIAGSLFLFGGQKYGKRYPAKQPLLLQVIS